MQTDTKTEIYYGWYSKEADMVNKNGGGYLRIFWEKVNGEVVEVTCVTKDKEGDSYKWPDKVFVGEVTKCIM